MRSVHRLGSSSTRARVLSLALNDPDGETTGDPWPFFPKMPPSNTLLHSISNSSCLLLEGIQCCIASLAASVAMRWHTVATSSCMSLITSESNSRLTTGATCEMITGPWSRNAGGGTELPRSAQIIHQLVFQRLNPSSSFVLGGKRYSACYGLSLRLHLVNHLPVFPSLAVVSLLWPQRPAVHQPVGSKRSVFHAVAVASDQLRCLLPLFEDYGYPLA